MTWDHPERDGRIQTVIFASGGRASWSLNICTLFGVDPTKKITTRRNMESHEVGGMCVNSLFLFCLFSLPKRQQELRGPRSAHARM
jgi:hypothetical protein